MEEIRLWNVQGNLIQEIPKQKLDLENRLHDWILKDLSVALPDTILLGSKVRTDHGKEVDILGIDAEGDLVIIELKRGLTPRDDVAQSLDYAAWAGGLKEPDINEILQKQGKQVTVAELFEHTFPDSEIDEFNENQKILIVGSEIDDITGRIIKYLSTAPRQVSINAVTFSYFKDKSGNEFVARNFLIEPEDQPATTGAKRKRDKAFFKTLFEAGKLKIGDEVVYKPAITAGIPSTDPRISATIETVSRNCLRRKSDNSGLYSFSKLRRTIVVELKLQDINPDWGFGQRNEWQLKDGTILGEL